MQSGINASAELLSAFRAFVHETPLRADNGQPELRGNHGRPHALFASIKNSKIEPDGTETNSEAVVARLKKKLDDHEFHGGDLGCGVNQKNQKSSTSAGAACYIIVRRPEQEHSDPYSSKSISYDCHDDVLTIFTFVPECANVREKTLYASSRLTLIRELGRGMTSGRGSAFIAAANFSAKPSLITKSGSDKHDEATESDNGYNNATIRNMIPTNPRFGPPTFATEPEELSEAGWKEIIAHRQAENPLTEEEEMKKKICASEAHEISMVSRFARRAAHESQIFGNASNSQTTVDTDGGNKTMGTFGVKMPDSAKDRLLEFAQNKGTNLLVLKIDQATETVNLEQNQDKPENDASPQSVTPELIQEYVDWREPQYMFYRFHSSKSATISPKKSEIVAQSDATDSTVNMSEGKTKLQQSNTESPQVIFVYVCPTGIDRKSGMLAACLRNSVVKAGTDAGLSIVRKIEVSDKDDISGARIEGEIKHIQINKQNALAGYGVGEQSLGQKPFAKPKKPQRRVLQSSMR